MKGCESITFSDDELSIEQFSRCEPRVAGNQHGITTATTRCIHFFVLQIRSVLTLILIKFMVRIASLNVVVLGVICV